MANLSKFIAREQHVPLEQIMLLRHSSDEMERVLKAGSNLAIYTALQFTGKKYDFHKYSPKITLVAVVARNFDRKRDEVCEVFAVGEHHKSGTILTLVTAAHLEFELANREEERRKGKISTDRPARLFDLTPLPSVAVGCEVTGWAGREISTPTRHGSLIFGELTVDLSSSPLPTLVPDIEAIKADEGLTRTTRDALISARVGQGEFRTQVLNAWGCRCAATGCSVVEIIRASHIKPWRDSTNSERLDPNNGLPLIATLDALFDVGLITFELDGTLLCSALLPEREQDRFALPKALTQKPTDQQRVFLAHHKQHHFRR